MLCKNTVESAIDYHKHLQYLITSKDDINRIIEELQNNQTSHTTNETNDEFQINELEEAMEELQNNANNEENVETLVENLNVDQKRVFDFIKGEIAIENKPIRHFVSGVGDTGKSYLIKTIKAYVTNQLNQNVAITAPTGIAAYNIQGMTIHRLLQLPVEHGHTPPYRPLSNDSLKLIREKMKNVILVIIYEISMVSNVTLIYIHLRLCEIYDTGSSDDGWFGKINILVFGDLLQLPPVNEQSPFLPLNAKISDKYLHALGTINLWEKLFTYDELTENMRQKSDPEYANILERTRINTVTRSDIQAINKQKISFKIKTTPSDIIRQLYETIMKLPDSTLVLLPTREHCSFLNNGILSLLPSDNISLESIDSVDCKQSTKTKVIKKLSKLDDDSSRTAGLQKYLNVNLNCKIILQRNIDVSNGLVNGAIGTFKNIINGIDGKPQQIQVIFNEKMHNLERVTGKFELFYGAFVFRKQFPITVAYGITIHKSQGMSLENCIVDVGNSIFSCGQTYVALSRVNSLKGLHLISFDPSNIKAQIAAIKEYNRLRAKCRPDLNKIPLKHNQNIHVKDIIWKEASNVQFHNIQTFQHQPISDLRIPGFSNSDAVSCYANASLQVIFNCTRILNILINSLKDTVLKKLAYSYTSQVCQLSAFSIRNQIGHPYVNIEQQDAAEFISALIPLYEPLHNSLLHLLQTILKCSRCKKSRVHISNNYIIQLNVPNDTKTVTMHSMLNDMSKEVTIENITCSACNTTSNHTQTTNILNTHEYLYFQIQLWSDVNTKITNLQINSLPTTTLTVDSKCYTLNSVICHHGQSMTEAHYTAIIKHQNKRVRCNDTSVQFERWPRGAKDVYIIIMEKK